MKLPMLFGIWCQIDPPISPGRHRMSMAVRYWSNLPSISHHMKFTVTYAGHGAKNGLVVENEKVFAGLFESIQGDLNV
ncbi:MAG: hypothetical protein U0V70_18915 [Terriglobia bacterium]